jgi:ribose 5-phosphate isomerase A
VSFVAHLVAPFAHQVVKLHLIKLGGTPILRQGKAKAGPVVTDNGNFLYDVDFGEIYEPKVLEARVKAIPGVIEVGLFCDMVHRAYFGLEDGNIKSRDRVIKRSHSSDSPSHADC